jgi:hypothetical protein
MRRTWPSRRHAKVPRLSPLYHPLVEVLEDRTLLSFITAPTYTAGPGPQSVAVGDFNGDGIPDLAVASLGDDADKSTLSILLGKGDGTFQAAQNYVIGTEARSVAAGDFNRDGHLDLAVVNSGNASPTLVSTPTIGVPAL